MKVTVNGNRIVLTQPPVHDVAGAFFLIFNRQTKDKEVAESIVIDAQKGRVEYKLPKGVNKKDVEALYLRVL